MQREGYEEVTKPFFRDIVIYAFRYAITRQSMAGSIFTDWLRENISMVTNHDIRLMVREISEEVEHDYFTNIDKPTWVNFGLFLQKVLNEREDRHG